MGMVVRQLMFGSPSTRNSTTDAVKEVLVMLVSSICIFHVCVLNLPLLIYSIYMLNLAAVKERASNGYLLIATSGGLNQQRTGVRHIVFMFSYIFFNFSLSSETQQRK